MNGFRVAGTQGHIEIQLEEVYGFPEATSHFGGYDAKASVEIKSGNYSVKGEMYVTTREISLFYDQLKACYQRLDGEVEFANYDVSLELKLCFNAQGHVLITGRFKERPELDNELRFEMESDQSYLISALEDMEQIVQQYGGMGG
ncbi:hypothetical protein MKX64_04290 [Paenibacillus sp. FSL M8-0334]|uniref:WapI family immunity protein n=1 Tax=Paenibacillus sp. FSL M8-0334 TaxID=2921623 RepID=UPI0030F9B632